MLFGDHFVRRGFFEQRSPNTLRQGKRHRFFPSSLCFEDQFDDFSCCSPSTAPLRRVVAHLFELRRAIRYAYSETRALGKRDIGQVVAVIDALQSLRGIAKVSAVSIMAEVGELSRFEHARQLMGYSGAVARPGVITQGKATRRSGRARLQNVRHASQRVPGLLDSANIVSSSP